MNGKVQKNSLSNISCFAAGWARNPPATGACTNQVCIYLLMINLLILTKILPNAIPCPTIEKAIG